MHTTMTSWGFKRVSIEHCLYYRETSEGFHIVGVYMDDFLCVASSPTLNDALDRELCTKWDITVGDSSYILGLHITRDRVRRLIHISQTAFINQMVTKHRLEDARPVSTPLDVDLVLSKDQCPKTEEEIFWFPF